MLPRIYILIDCSGIAIQRCESSSLQNDRVALFGGNTLKSIVICPYSMKQMIKHDNNNKLSDNQMIIDTLEHDHGSVEGMSFDVNPFTCNWKGTLSDLINTTHLRTCTLKFNPTYFTTITINKLRQKMEKRA